VTNYAADRDALSGHATNSLVNVLDAKNVMVLDATAVASPVILSVKIVKRMVCRAWRCNGILTVKQIG